MTATAHPTPPLVYIASDIPEGVTLVEWRRRRHEHDARRSTGAAAVAHLCRLGR